MAKKKTRSYWITLLVTSLLSVGSLADSPQFPNFIARWTASPLKKTSDKNGDFESRLFTRYVFSPAGPFSVGSVTYIKTPKPKQPGTAMGDPASYAPDQVAAHIAKAMGFTSWHQRSQKNAKVYEQYWEKLDRIVRLYVVEGPDSFITSVAIWRVAYGNTVAIETEILQRQLTGSLEMRIPWLEKATASLDSLIEASAQAETPCPPCGTNPLSQLACATCQAGALSGPLTNLGNAANGLSNTAASNWPETNKQLGAANANAAAANTNWANTNTQLAGANANLADANKNWAATNKNWADTNVQLSRANDTAAQALDPAHMFVVGAATGAGIAFGGLLVSLVSEGVGKLIGGLVELITGTMADQERLQKFEEKRQEYEKLKPQVQKLESAIDGDIRVMRMADQANTHCTPSMSPEKNPESCPKYCNPPLSGKIPVVGRECLISMVSTTIEAEKLNYKKITEIAEATAGNPNASQACRDEMIASGAKLATQLKQNQELLETLTKFDHDNVCDGARNAIRELITAEAQISSARARLTSEASRQSWRKAQYAKEQVDRELSDHRLSDSEKQLKDDRSRALDAWRDENKRLKDDMIDSEYKDQYKKYLSWKSDWVDYCTTHSESWDDPASTLLVSDGKGNTQHKQITSGGNFACGIPLIGGACMGIRQKCAEHHQDDVPPKSMQGPWWDTYSRRKERAKSAYWLSYKQAQSNYDAVRAAALGSKPDPMKQARARQEYDTWLNEMLDDENVIASTAKLNQLDEKQSEIVGLCADKW